MGNRLFDAWRIAGLIVSRNWKGGKREVPKKLKGAVALNLVRNYLAAYVRWAAPDLEVSVPNCYILGSNFEYDLLVVRKNRKPVPCFENAGKLVKGASDGLIYSATDVVAIIEVKWSGLHNIKKYVLNISGGVKAARIINPRIHFGYLTFTERVPVKKFFRSGVMTKNLPELTTNELENQLNDVATFFISTRMESKHAGLTREISDYSEFKKFADFLIEHEN